ncbi:hypothetical protein PFY12_00645 [Chryseobacterium camelliae]|uniref:DUF4390 domain-containing protein n=1 Tax=Chryseobacterium camelliae TaxID=1265445 RepID=A0ABY7QLW8_9FLAO|nr:hypothetical protein [Chryseobacterium camelliae]WBV60640.1 hypothetical protein PFY12_00645 [Chryseobacterium camelliae]
MNYKIYLLYSFLLFSFNLSGQIKIEWSLNVIKQKADIIIRNESNKNVVIPIDTTSLQAYFSDDQIIKESNWSENYPFFALALQIYNYENQERVLTNSSAPYLDVDELNLKKDSISKKYKDKINSWKIKNRIKKENIAQINYYLVNNLRFLEPKDELKFEVAYNLRNITNQEIGVHDSYILEKGKKYFGFISFRTDRTIYDFLTDDQKKSIKEV